MKPFALLFSVVSAVGLVVLPAMSVHAAATTSTAVVFAPLNNGQLSPNQDLVIAGTISNVSDNDLPAGTATAYLDRALVSSRSDLGNWMSSTDPVGTDKLGSAVASAATPAIAAGHSISLTLTVPAAAIGLDSSSGWGPRTLAVQISAGQVNLGQSRTAVVWYPSADVPAVSLAVAMPLTVPSESVGLIPADVLAQYTAPDGLLTRALDQSIDRHIALGIDPMIIASIRILGTSAPTTAIAWLQRLQEASNETFPLTYADSDVAAVRQAGAPGLLAPTSFAIDPRLFSGYTSPPTSTPTTTPSPNPTVTPPPALPTTETLTDFAYTDGLSSTVWPGDDTVVEADLDAFAADGFTRTILSSGNVSYGDLNYTPGSAANVGKQSALVSDEQLSGLLRAAVSAPDDASWQKDVANLSAALAVVAGQKGAETRQLLATLDRNASSASLRLAETMQAIASTPWADFIRLTDIAGLATPAVSASLDGKPESSSRISTVRSLLDSEADVGNFSSVLADPTVLTGERRLSLLAVLANSWSGQSAAWRTAAGKYNAASTKILDSVKIAQTGSQALLSDTVNLGVAVTNDLDWPVTVYVAVRSPGGAIEIEKPRVELTVEANSQAKASIPVKALANGDVTVRASLTSATGIAIGSPVSLDVDVQAGWETVFTAIVAVGLALVFGFGIYRNIVKRRRQKRAALAEKTSAAGAARPGEPNGS